MPRKGSLYTSKDILSSSAQQQQQQRRSKPTPESWEDFHQQYHSDRFRHSANNPSILRLVGLFGSVPNTFHTGKESKAFMADQIRLRQDDNMSSCSGSSGSHTGSFRSDRGRRMNDSSSGMLRSSRRRSQGNIKIGQPPQSTRKWTFPFFSTSNGFSSH